jgi:hypothetical protein
VEYVGIILIIAVLFTAMMPCQKAGGLKEIPEVLVDQLEKAIERVK